MPRHDEVGLGAAIRARRFRNVARVAAGAATYTLGGVAGRYAQLEGSDVRTPSRGDRVPRQFAKRIRDVHEPKNNDTASASFALSSTVTPFTVCLNTLYQGSGGINRTGRMVLMDRIRLCLNFSKANASNTDDIVRVVLVLDKESRSAAMSSTDLLSSNSSTVLQVASSYDFDNVPTRFKILYDKCSVLHTGNPTGLAGTAFASFAKIDTLHIPINEMCHFYNTNAGTYGDIDSNALWLFVYSLNTANPPYLAYDSRVIFRDV